jgi:isochorismate synthase
MNYSIFDKLIDCNLHFAIYKLPDREEIHLIMQNDKNVLTVDDIEDVCNHKGFVISPFINSKQTPAIFIRPDIHLTGTNEIVCFLKDFFRNEITFDRSEYYKDDPEDDFEEYRASFNIFHEALRSKQFDKIVLSRPLTVRKKSGFSLERTFKSAVKKYPSAFVYLLNTPQTGVWFGCSPEVLLSGKNSEWKTVALAGTRKIKSGKPAWDDKNMAEHRIVVDFITEQLEKMQITYEKGDSSTVRAGNIEHCKVDFTISLDSPAKAGILLKALHPTPAVSGYPRNEAVKFIVGNERHERLYYSGFAGAVNVSDATNLFVNIRCMQVLDNKLRLYAGGGLTVLSELNDEWLETEYKLQTLLSLFETETQHVASAS